MLSKEVKRVTGVLLFLIVGSYAITAQSAVIVQSESFNLSNTTNYASTTGSGAFDSSETTTWRTFNRFDSSLGTLNSVSLTLSGYWSHYAGASAFDGNGGSCSIFSTCTNDTWVGNNAYTQFTVNVADPSSTSDYISDSLHAGCGDSTTFYWNSSSSAENVSCSDGSSDVNNFYTMNINLSSIATSAWIGTTNLVDIQLRNYASINLSCDNNDSGDSCSGYNDSYWNGTMNLVYDFTPTPVPAPAAISLFLMGLLMIWRRQRVLS